LQFSDFRALEKSEGRCQNIASGNYSIFNFEDKEVNSHIDKHVPCYLIVLEGHGCPQILSAETFKNI
jgi:hypothetical protein